MKGKCLFVLSLVFVSISTWAARPVLRVGTEGLYPPYNFCGTVEAPVECGSAADAIGFDIDVAKAVCAQIDHDCQFVLNDWTTMFTNLAGNRYDTVFAAVGYRQQRTAYGDYTITYENVDAAAGVYFFAKASNVANLTFTPEGMAGKKIGVQTGTLHEDYLRRVYNDSTIVTYGTQEEVNNALLADTVVAVLTNADVMTQFLAQHAEVVKGNEYPISYDENGFNQDNIFALVRKNNRDELLFHKINNAILKLQMSGFIKERHQHWVGNALRTEKKSNRPK
jgi:arginine/ornithine transport system substrate-binding protein